MRNAVAALAALIVMTASAPAQGWAEKMFKGRTSHDFGTVARGAQLTHNFTITNIYAVRMEITSIKSGCGCVTAAAAKRVLEPRESTTIEVRMDGRRFNGPKKVQVRVTVGPEYISSAEIVVTANSRADIVFNPGEISFGTVARGSTPTQTVDVEYAGALDFKVIEAVASDMPYAVSVKEIYRRPGQVGYRLSATLKSDAPAGAHRHNIYLKTNDPASPTVSVLVESNVTVVTPVTVTPTQLTLGTFKADSPVIRRIVVRGLRPFRITGIDGLGEGVELGAALSAKDEAVQFVTIRCQVKTSGSFRRELKIKTTAQEAPVSVFVEGTAAP